jgi:hypothetical protein
MPQLNFLSPWFRLCRDGICAGIGDPNAGLFNRNFNGDRDNCRHYCTGHCGLCATAFPLTGETDGSAGETRAGRAQGTGGDDPLVARCVLPQWRDL